MPNSIDLLMANLAAAWINPKLAQQQADEPKPPPTFFMTSNDHQFKLEHQPEYWNEVWISDFTNDVKLVISANGSVHTEHGRIGNLTLTGNAYNFYENPNRSCLMTLQSNREKAIIVMARVALASLH